MESLGMVDAIEILRKGIIVHDKLIVCIPNLDKNNRIFSDFMQLIGEYEKSKAEVVLVIKNVKVNIL